MMQQILLQFLLSIFGQLFATESSHTSTKSLSNPQRSFEGCWSIHNTASALTKLLRTLYRVRFSNLSQRTRFLAHYYFKKFDLPPQVSVGCFWPLKKVCLFGLSLNWSSVCLLAKDHQCDVLLLY